MRKQRKGILYQLGYHSNALYNWMVCLSLDSCTLKYVKLLVIFTSGISLYNRYGLHLLHLFTACGIKEVSTQWIVDSFSIGIAKQQKCESDIRLRNINVFEQTNEVLPKRFVYLAKDQHSYTNLKNKQK